MYVIHDVYGYSNLYGVYIEDAYGESPPPPAFVRIRLCGRTLWPKLGRAIGLRVPPAVVGTLRGTLGGGRRGGSGEGGG